MTDRLTLQRWIGAVLAPEVRSPGTIASKSAIVPPPDYLAEYPPALVVAFGRLPSGARAPLAELRAVREACLATGHQVPLVACDLEQGAGLHFESARRLPPALALASAALSYPSERAGFDALLAAGELTAREALAQGVQLVLAPVADVNTQRSNPIVAVRSFGDEPRAAGQRAAAFLIGLHAGGALGCAKHFPGHGDTAQDSHIELARVPRDAAGLRETELAPFRTLIEHGVDTVMVGHLDVPALGEPAGTPATFSRAALEGVLRTELGFDGVVVSDAMNMGALARYEQRYVRALAAGCDVLLCPHDPRAAAEELLAAALAGRLSLERLEQAALRAASLRQRAAQLAPRTAERWPRTLDASLAEELALRSLRWLGAAWPSGASGQLVARVPTQVGPEFAAAWETASVAAPDAGRLPCVAAVLEMGAWRGSYGLSAAEDQALRAELARAAAQHGHAGLVWFGSPQQLPEWALRDARLSVLLALAPTPPQLQAVVQALTGASQRVVVASGVGSLPTRVG
jgi:beta-glucosidase